MYISPCKECFVSTGSTNCSRGFLFNSVVETSVFSEKADVSRDTAAI